MLGGRLAPPLLCTARLHEMLGDLHQEVDNPQLGLVEVSTYTLPAELARKMKQL